MNKNRFDKLKNNLLELNLIDKDKYEKTINDNTYLINLTLNIISKFCNSNITLESCKSNIKNLQDKNNGYHMKVNDIDYNFNNYPHDEVFINDFQYIEKFKILDNSKKNDIIIDVGFKDGYWFHSFKHYFHKECITIGIDPIDNKCSQDIDYFFNCAIDNIENPTKSTFHIFDEPGCNSLIEKNDDLTNRNVIKKIEVGVLSLEYIIDKLNLQNKTIYYLKPDAQGKDKDVVLSLKKYLKNIKYVELELNCSYNSSLYKKQSTVLEDIIELYKIGFIPIHFTMFRLLLGSLDNINNKLINECEIIFKNININ